MGLVPPNRDKKAESTTSWSELARRLEVGRSCTGRGYRWEERDSNILAPSGTEVTTLRLARQSTN